MYIIAGLGNPGEKYDNTRHNAGFLTIDALASKYNIDVREKAHKALIGKGVIEGQKVILAKPQTYMTTTKLPRRNLLLFSTTSAWNQDSFESARREAQAATMELKALSLTWEPRSLQESR